MFEAKKMKKYVLAAAFGACLLHGGATAHAEDVYAVTSPSGDQRYYVVTETITEKEDGFSVVVKIGWKKYQEYLYEFRFVDGEWQEARHMGNNPLRWHTLDHPTDIAVFETANEYR